MADVFDPKTWPRWADGYQSCPGCGCLVHPTYAKVHADCCPEIAWMGKHGIERPGTTEEE